MPKKEKEEDKEKENQETVWLLFLPFVCIILTYGALLIAACWPEKDSSHHAIAPTVPVTASPVTAPPLSPTSNGQRNYLGGTYGGLSDEEQRLTVCSDRCESDAVAGRDANDFLVHINEADPHSISFQTPIANDVTNASGILRTGQNVSVSKVYVDTYAQRVGWMSETWLQYLDIAYPLQLVFLMATGHYNVAYVAYYHLYQTPRNYTVVAKRVDESPYGKNYTNYYESTRMACFCACDPSFCDRPPSPPPLPPMPPPPPSPPPYTGTCQEYIADHTYGNITGATLYCYTAFRACRLRLHRLRRHRPRSLASASIASASIASRLHRLRPHRLRLAAIAPTTVAPTATFTPPLPLPPPLRPRPHTRLPSLASTTALASDSTLATALGLASVSAFATTSASTSTFAFASAVRRVASAAILPTATVTPHRPRLRYRRPTPPCHRASPPPPSALPLSPYHPRPATLTPTRPSPHLLAPTTVSPPSPPMVLGGSSAASIRIMQ
ncbi:hypothetical protein CYMTET_40338 [Cymbomonas tetramitiformis]|uniref:Uncharacterized protein n=1 Tax=Cymbomonas tetramitiformis TaxID=36881 RepID=A0AAE0C8B8_9CHLO|nr:hypothetical protein CYMTET_40338 [Cymbomonas tetramitiformis]